MRLADIAAVSALATSLGACTPYAETYSYTVRSVPVAPYGYAPAPYYSEPAYPGPAYPGPAYPGPVYAAPYAVPGPTVIVSGERRVYDDRRRYDDRYRDGRPGPENFRGPPPGRVYGQGRGPEPAREAGRPAPAPVAAPVAAPPRPAAPRPGPAAAPPSGVSPLYHAPSFNPADPTAHGGHDN